MEGVENKSVRNLIRDNYRAGAEIGDGSTAEAVRHTIRTGELVGGSDHIQKAQETINRIDNIISNQGSNLSGHEMEVVQQIRRNLKDALDEAN